MHTLSDEIISDILEHVRKFGGDFAAWCIGTACNWHSPSLEVHEVEEKNDELICREAYTSAGARAVQDYFVNERGMAPGSDETGQGARLVYVYKNLALGRIEAQAGAAETSRKVLPHLARSSSPHD